MTGADRAYIKGVTDGIKLANNQMIRCDQCMYFYDTGYPKECSLYRYPTTEDDYCSRGVRKKSDE